MERHACSGLCQFDVRRFTPETLREMIIVHPLVVIGGRICRNPYYVAPEKYLSPASRARVPEGTAIIQKMFDQVRTLAFELRPSLLDEFGLVEALRNLVMRHGERAGVRVSFTATPTDARAPVEIETACFRIVQEALTNVARHARARHVDVTLTAQDMALELTVRDDGVGFDVERLRTGLGLVGMGERADFAGGRLDIESAPGAGTTLRALFPLPLSRATMN